jgi:hypothetical protein
MTHSDKAPIRPRKLDMADYRAAMALRDFVATTIEHVTPSPGSVIAGKLMALDGLLDRVLDAISCGFPSTAMEEAHELASDLNDLLVLGGTWNEQPLEDEPVG